LGLDGSFEVNFELGESRVELGGYGIRRSVCKSLNMMIAE